MVRLKGDPLMEHMEIPSFGFIFFGLLPMLRNSFLRIARSDALNASS
jgi:hypothetical protein